MIIHAINAIYNNKKNNKNGRLLTMKKREKNKKDVKYMSEK